MAKAPKITLKTKSHDAIKRYYGYEHKFRTAANFYHVLLNFSDMMDKSLLLYKSIEDVSPRWIFHGHWDSDWDLIPSAFRPEECKKFQTTPQLYSKTDLDIPHPEWEIEEKLEEKIQKERKEKIESELKYQIKKEYFLLRQFMEIANPLGIECSHDSSIYDYEEKIQKDIIKEIKKWPYNEILPLMALARHHGLPTRFLDFTYNPLFAAFFAASNPFFEEYLKEETDEKKIKKTSEDKKKKKKKNEDLCIWVVDERRTTKPIGRTHDNPWQKVPVFGNRSSNIFAQEGLLILDPKANKRFTDYGAWQDLTYTTDGDECFLKLTLPQSECKELLRLLWKNNITPARIMPNLDKVTQTVAYSLWLWENPR